MFWKLKCFHFEVKYVLKKSFQKVFSNKLLSFIFTTTFFNKISKTNGIPYTGYFKLCQISILLKNFLSSLGNFILFFIFLLVGG